MHKRLIGPTGRAATRSNAPEGRAREPFAIFTTVSRQPAASAPAMTPRARHHAHRARTRRREPALARYDARHPCTGDAAMATADAQSSLPGETASGWVVEANPCSLVVDGRGAARPRPPPCCSDPPGRCHFPADRWPGCARGRCYDPPRARHAPRTSRQRGRVAQQPRRPSPIPNGRCDPSALPHCPRTGSGSLLAKPPFTATEDASALQQAIAQARAVTCQQACAATGEGCPRMQAAHPGWLHARRSRPAPDAP